MIKTGNDGGMLHPAAASIKRDLSHTVHQKCLNMFMAHFLCY